MAKLSRRAGRVLGVPAGLIAGAIAAALALSGVLFRFEVLTLDARMTMRGERELDPRIALIRVDEETFNLLGWPISRGVYGYAATIAREHGARAVAFDVIFAESRDDEQEALLAKAARDCNCIIFPTQLRRDENTGAIVADEPIAVLKEASVARAHVQLDNTVDGTFRAVPLTLTKDGVPYAPLAVALARAAGKDIPDREGTAWLAWRTANVRGASLLDVVESQTAIASGEKPKLDLDAMFKGSVVFVGQTAMSVGDRGAVPFVSDAPLVSVHANFVDNLLNDRTTAPPSTTLAALLSLLLAVIVGTAVTGMRAAKGTLTAAGAVVALWAAGTWAFSDSEIWIPLAAPTLAAALAYVGASVLNVWVRDADERKLRAAFDRYVSPHILEKVLQNADNVDIRGHRRTLTLLFSDIKGYTTLSNTLAPDEIVELLCTYLDTMVDIILRHEGTVDKIMGDGIMAFFGDPLPQQDHALRCIRCALDMQRATAKLGEKWVARGLSPLQVRIGIATGDVFVGSIGSRQHLEYTAIGRPVNLAARLEGKAPPGGVLVAKETYELVKEHVSAHEVRGLDLKGYSGGYDAWLIVGMAGEEGARLEIDQRQRQRQAFFTDVTLTIGGVDFKARSSDISPGGMFIHCDVLPPSGSGVRVTAALARGATVQIDGVVTHTREGKDGAGGAGVMFMAVYADDRSAIEALLQGVLGEEGFEESRVAAAAADDEKRGKLTYKLDPPKLDPNDTLD